MKEKQRKLCMDVLGMLIGRGCMLGMNPIGMGYFLSVYAQEPKRPLLAVCILLGMSTVMKETELVKYGLSMLVSAIVFHLAEHTGKRLTAELKYAVGAGVGAVLALTGGMFTIQYKTYIIMAILEGILIFVFARLFQAGIGYFLYHRKREGMSSEEMVSTGILIGVMAYGMPDMGLETVSAAAALSYFLVLITGYKYGPGLGAIAGAACGIALAFQGKEVVLIGILCVLGIGAGLFQETGKWWTGIAFLATGVSVGYLYADTLMEMESVKALVIGCGAFLCIPAKYVKPMSWNRSEEKDTYVRQNIQLLTKNKVQEFSDSLQQLSGSFSKFTRERQAVSYADVNEIFEDISGRFCRECDRCQSCWGDEYDFTYAAAQSLFLTARKQGYVAMEDVPENFCSQCIHAGEFVEETNYLLQKMKESLGIENRLAESRQAVAGQLHEMARMMRDFASELYEIKEVRTKLEEEMIERLKKNHIDVQKLVIMERRERRKEIHLMGRMRLGRCVTAREIAVMLGQVMGKRLKPAEQTKTVLGRELEVMVFIEDTPYKTLTGVARATKEGEEISGDNFSILSLDNGEEVLLLSDGMGSGEQANRESCLVVELLEHFLEAGFDKEAAIRMINSTYVLQSDSQSFSTIDLGSIDLYTGKIEFLKLGGAASFIKRRDGIQCIRAETFPAGMFQQIELLHQTETLSDGEFVVMVTDGILDCFEGENKEDYIAFLLEETKSINPREIADYILHKALEENQNKNLDDMTVLVAGLWEKA
ncbi:MAG: stage II sporulation protein E [Acetivibrio ethanolgignens]